MPNPYFQFKQFTIWHDKCAMKVGTDGVLLGAWASCGQAHSILDIGCGSGVVTLMLAQRSQAVIDAIDIEENAVIQTRENAGRTPWADRIRSFHSALQTFMLPADRIPGYDLIVSNPPYFIDSQKCPDTKRNTARHTDSLSVYDLLLGSRRLLSPNGHIVLILPFDQRERLLHTARELSFSLCRELWVCPVPGATPKRLLADFSLNPADQPATSQTLTIEIARHQYTEEYIALTRDFYLKM